METRGMWPGSFRFTWLLFLPGWLVATPAGGEEVTGPGPYLLRDINTWRGDYFGTPRVELGSLFHAGNRSYFAADDFEHGLEIWTTDGSREGTRLLEDVREGPQGSFPRSFAAAGDRVCFAADGDDTGVELWTSDGTEEGTRLVRDIRPGPLGSYPDLFAVLNGHFYYTADDGVHGREIWESDGVTASLVLDIAPGDMSGVNSEGVVLGGKIYFAAYDPTHDSYDLWETDGTIDGMRVIKDFLEPGGVWSSLLALEDRLYFLGFTPDQGLEPWVSDGTIPGTRLVKDVRPGRSGTFSPLAAAGRFLFFKAVDEAHGVEPWVSDGTEDGTHILRDIRPEAPGSHPADFLAVGDRVVFTADDGIHGTELWVSDGTEAGTRLLADLRPGPESSSPQIQAGAGGRAYFTTDDETRGLVLWASDGTGTGTGVALDLARTPGLGSEPQWLRLFPGETGDLLQVDYGSFGAEFLWRDRTTGAVTSIARGTSRSDGGGINETPVALGGSAYFPALDGEHGAELWTSDGTAMGTRLVSDINPGPGWGWGNPAGLTSAAGVLLFNANVTEGIQNTQLWASDGTAAGTRPIGDVRGAELTLLGDRILLTAQDEMGLELWASHVAGGGSRRVKDIYEGLAGSYPLWLTAFDGRVYFAADDGTNGRELWVSDGTEEGTFLLADIREGPASSSPFSLAVLDGRLYFWADDGVHGGELWVSDGDAEGTRILKDIRPGPEGSFAQFESLIAVTPGRLYFAADDGTLGPEPWVSDGTELGTRLLREIRGGQGGSSPEDFTAVGHAVYFSADDGEEGKEPWITDGTEEGTRLLAAIRTGPEGSSPEGFTPAGDRIYFRADDGLHGRELWMSDGTETLLVADLHAGPEGAFYDGPVNSPVVAGNTLFIVGEDGFHGRELWALLDPANHDPRIIAELEVREGAGGEVVLDGSRSESPLGAPIVSWLWTLSDGSTLDGPEHRLSFAPGRHRILLTVTDGGGRSGTSHRTRVESCPAGDLGPWTGSDVGRMPLGFEGGSRLEAGGERLEICAGGRGIGAARDDFHFVHRIWNGDLELEADVLDLSGPPGSQAGIMVREGLEPGARHGSLLVQAGQDGAPALLRILMRASTGGPTEVMLEEPASGLSSLRLVRRGDFILAYSSPGSTSPGDPVASFEIPGLATHLFAGAAVHGLETSPADAFLAARSTLASLAIEEAPAAPFVRGDSNGDGAKNISDAISTLGFLFLGSPSRLDCEKAADVDDDGAVNLSDALGLLNNLFLGAPPPRPPYPDCGEDPSPDELPCSIHRPCP
jgi:ELWxxDGT repeat protein